jgi:ComF family protein
VRFITPPYCRRCGLPYPGQITQEFQCENCAETEFSFTSARSAVAANALILDIIHRYKYNRAVWFEPFLADLLARQVVPALAQEKWDMIVPVPLHPAKEREREFNQASRLARRLGRALCLPVQTRLLRRVKFTDTQTRLSRPQRAANMKHAFAPRAGKDFHGAKVILVDDVLTTGATTDACAHALRRAGAGAVCVWTVARGI